MASPATDSPREHPEATKVLIFGILGLTFCQVLAPFAWITGNRVVKEIDATPGGCSNRGMANAGRICGMVGTVLLLVWLVITIAIVAVTFAGDSTAIAPVG